MLPVSFYLFNVATRKEKAAYVLEVYFSWAVLVWKDPSQKVQIASRVITERKPLHGKAIVVKQIIILTTAMIIVLLYSQVRCCLHCGCEQLATHYSNVKK